MQNIIFIGMNSKLLEFIPKTLHYIKDNYPKLILSLDNDPDSNHNGIMTKNALEWMMEA